MVKQQKEINKYLLLLSVLIVILFLCGVLYVQNLLGLKKKFTVLGVMIMIVMYSVLFVGEIIIFIKNAKIKTRMGGDED